MRVRAGTLVPTLDPDDASKDAFYMDVQMAINQIPRKDLHVTAGLEGTTTQPPLATLLVAFFEQMLDRYASGDRRVLAVSLNHH